MINKELKKRILTSLFLIMLLIIVFFYTYILLISLIIISIITWIEFNVLISRIFIKKNFKSDFLKLVLKATALLYLVLFSGLIFNGIAQIEPNFKLEMFYLFATCITSDIGGLIFGKFFKGKKLTKISPNKTISGSAGSFILSLMMVPFFYYFFRELTDPLQMIILTIIVSFICQLGDLFVSYLKRKAKVKDTGDLLPGHGGILDRIDGMLFAIPFGIMLFNLLT